MKWISSKERLPESSMSAVVTDGRLVAMADWYVKDQRFYVGRDDLLLSSDRITHWMPLPEPPTPQQPRNEAMFAALQESAEALKDMPVSGSTEDTLKIIREGRAGAMYGYDPTK